MIYLVILWVLDGILMGFVRHEAKLISVNYLTLFENVGYMWILSWFVELIFEMCAIDLE